MTNPSLEPAAFPVLVHDNHLIANFGDFTALLDTGSPWSISSTVDEIHLPCMLESIRPVSDFMGKSVESIVEMVGHPFDVLMGLDCLGSFCWQVDGIGNDSSEPKLLIHLSSQMPAPTSSLSVMQFPQLGTLPIGVISIEGQEVRAYLDTGAKISYLNKERQPCDDRPAREAVDFSPHFGEFTTRIREFDVLIGELRLNLPMGELPPVGNVFWNTFNVDAILGLDLLRQLSVEFVLPEEMIHFDPRDGA